MIEILESFFRQEKENLWKSDWHMKKIYYNRLEQDLKTEDREIIIFLVDKLWEAFFDYKLTEEYLDKLLFWLREFLWKWLDEAIENHISYRKANLR